MYVSLHTYQYIVHTCICIVLVCNLKVICMSYSIILCLLTKISPKYLGAIVVALGSGAAGVFTNSDVLWSDLEQVHNYVFSFCNKL